MFWSDHIRFTSKQVALIAVCYTQFATLLKIFRRPEGGSQTSVSRVQTKYMQSTPPELWHALTLSNTVSMYFNNIPIFFYKSMLKLHDVHNLCIKLPIARY